MNDTVSAARALRRAIRSADLAGLCAALGAGADPNGQSPDEQPPLDAAIRRKAWQLCGALLNAGADPNPVDPASGEPGLPLASLAGVVSATHMSNGAAALAARLLASGCSPDAAIVEHGPEAWDDFRRDVFGRLREKRAREASSARARSAASAQARQRAAASAKMLNAPVLFVEPFSIGRAMPAGTFERFSFGRGAWIPETVAIWEPRR